MYAIVKKVVSPASTSVRTLVPCSESLKKRSSMNDSPDRNIFRIHRNIFRIHRNIFRMQRNAVWSTKQEGVTFQWEVAK